MKQLKEIHVEFIFEGIVAVVIRELFDVDYIESFILGYTFHQLDLTLSKLYKGSVVTCECGFFLISSLMFVLATNFSTHCTKFGLFGLKVVFFRKFLEKCLPFP